jgi:hypothetical protein
MSLETYFVIESSDIKSKFQVFGIVSQVLVFIVSFFTTIDGFSSIKTQEFDEGNSSFLEPL